MRLAVTLVVALVVVLVAGYAYTMNHDRLWNSGPVISVFRAAESPSVEQSVGITSDVRGLMPDGSPQSEVEAMLAADGFECKPAREAGEMSCVRKPFGLFCGEEWFVFYALRDNQTVDITHASKQLECA